jgi:hypothetical protein
VSLLRRVRRSLMRFSWPDGPEHRPARSAFCDVRPVVRSPPAWQSALRAYQERKPRRPPSKAIAINENTDGPAILLRVFSEPIEPDEDDLGPDLRDEDI